MRKASLMILGFIISLSSFAEISTSFDGGQAGEYSINTYWDMTDKKQGAEISVLGSFSDGSTEGTLVIQEYNSSWIAVGSSIATIDLALSGEDFTGKITIPENAPVSSQLTSGNFYLLQVLGKNGEFANAALTIIEGGNGSGINESTADWASVAIPTSAGEGKIWQLQQNVSDEFNYEAAASSSVQVFNGKWKNEYVNGWTGAGGALYSKEHSHVTGGNLCLENDFVAGKDPDKVKYYADNEIHYINTGNISSLNTVVYPVFAEIKAKMNEIPMASDFWMITLDQTQEIDVLEAFGTDRAGYEWWNTQLHLSHHTFIREPFQDYQPMDGGSWYKDNGRRWSASYFRIGVYWKGPFELEYYVDGEMVRSLYYNAVADKVGSTWKYSYQTMTAGVIDKNGGYDALTTHSTSTEFSQEKLEAASAASGVNIIDAYNYLDGKGLSKESYLLFCQGQQPWSGICPSYEELNDADKSVYKVDWIRVYKPVDGTTSTTNVEIDHEDFVAYNGASFKLKALVQPVYGNQKVDWKSLDETKAKVNSEGLVLCVGTGNDVAIVATSEDGTKTDTCYVDIMAEAIKGSITFDNPGQYENAKFESGESYNFTCNYKASTLHVINNDGVVVQLQEIDSNGDVVMFKKGTSSEAKLSDKGSIAVSMILRNLTPTSELSAGHYYRLYAEFGQQTNLGVESDTIKCSETIDNIIVIAEGTHAADLESHNIVIYPNPATEIIYIEGLSDEKSEISIYNLQGVLMMSEIEVSSFNNELIVSALTSGIYIAVIEGLGKNKVLRFQIK